MQPHSWEESAATTENITEAATYVSTCVQIPGQGVRGGRIGAVPLEKVVYETFTGQTGRNGGFHLEKSSLHPILLNVDLKQTTPRSSLERGFFMLIPLVSAHVGHPLSSHYPDPQATAFRATRRSNSRERTHFLIYTRQSRLYSSGSVVASGAENENTDGVESN